jgi:phosphoribosylcarboxyaminoimidazole (NCAIR) mutase
MSNAAPVLVGVVMGSSSDWDVMQHAVAILKEFGIAHEARVVFRFWWTYQSLSNFVSNEDQVSLSLLD